MDKKNSIISSVLQEPEKKRIVKTQMIHNYYAALDTNSTCWKVTDAENVFQKNVTKEVKISLFFFFLSSTGKALEEDGISTVKITIDISLLHSPSHTI